MLGFFGCKGWEGVIFFNFRQSKLDKTRQRIVNQSTKVNLLSARIYLSLVCLFFHLGNFYQYFRESGMVDQGMVKNLDQILNPEKLATDAGVQVRSNILHLSLRTLIRLSSFQGKIT